MMYRHRCGTHAHAKARSVANNNRDRDKGWKNAFLSKWLESRGKAERERREDKKTEVTGWKARYKIRRGRNEFDNKTGSSVVTRYILTKNIAPVHYRAAPSTTFGRNVQHFLLTL